jgi:hypothetical protein
MLAVDQKTYELTGTGYPGNRVVDVNNHSASWMISFIFVISFVGLLCLVACKVLIDILEPCICYVYLIALLFFDEGI